MAVRYALLIPLILLPACASGGDGAWPSLAHRPGEGVAPGPCASRTSLTARPATPAPAPRAVPDILTGSSTGTAAPLTAQMSAELADIRQAWEAARVRTAQRIAAAGPPGSESWGTAQIALSRFEAVFARTAGIDAQLATDLPNRALGMDVDPERARLARDLAAFRDAHMGAFNEFRDRLEQPATANAGGSAPTISAAPAASEALRTDETAMKPTCAARQGG
ncbi:hypothetical protein KCG44_02895 [Pacificimonas sp. WHA3]|uniref:Lipoprotein n=1 Tax=Pacificimonas pallii TaxID=2827236 RepID=A0ABS6SBD5_9SPHN|nr:hypothetical protein [Pacificimonas pallii]MBV7255728.1 hypothetical protein [Pacificimonas pallii]